MNKYCSAENPNMRAIWEDSFQPDTKIWRYFKPSRFIEFLETSELHFASANQFEDRFEGSVAIQSPHYLVDPRYAEIDGVEKAFRELKRLTKISCWHCASFESDAMWKLYADPLIRRLRQEVSLSGYVLPVLCTPEELLNDEDD